MSLTRSELDEIAHLARLAVDEAEVPGYVDTLSRILDFVRQLDACDTAGVVPMAHPLATAQRLREDRVTETDERERLQRNAPEVEAGLYLVPRVIE